MCVLHSMFPNSEAEHAELCLGLDVRSWRLEQQGQKSSVSVPMKPYLLWLHAAPDVIHHIQQFFSNGKKLVLQHSLLNFKVFSSLENIGYFSCIQPWIINFTFKSCRGSVIQAFGLSRDYGSWMVSMLTYGFFFDVVDGEVSWHHGIGRVESD